MKHNSSDPIVPKKIILPFILVTSLFALWGFANAVTDPMVQAFKKVLELTNTQAAWVQMAFYGGYFCMALPAAIFVRKYSYKSGILVGLTLYALGSLLFYPAATTGEFVYFCLALYILTFGLSFLETTANPYILSMGSEVTATRRLNLAQAFNPVGLVGGLLVAKYFVLEKLQSDDISDFSELTQAKQALIRVTDLAIIRDPYVVLGIVVLFILILIALNKMPQTKEEEELPSLTSTLSKLASNKKYYLGVGSLVLYVGAQIMCWTYIYQYAEAYAISNSKAADYQLIAFILFTVGRVLGTYLLKYMSGGQLLALFGSLGMVSCVFTIFLSGHNGLIALVIISFFLSAMFPTIYGIALDGLSEDKRAIGASGLVMAIVGGALMPQIQGLVIDIGGPDVNDTLIWGVSEINFSFILPSICLLIIAFYGLWVNKKQLQTISS